MINVSASNTNNKKILHIMHNDKFNRDYISFINENFSPQEHLFIFVADPVGEMFPIPLLSNVKKLFCSRKRFYNYFWLLYYCIKADKIILHGLFVPQIVKFLYINRYLLKKCYWVLWGGDFYDDINNDYLSNISYSGFQKHKYFVAKNIYGYITYLDDDYKIAQKLYDSSALYFECLSYLSNLVKAFDKEHHKNNKNLNILVGNSATETNNHIEIFEKLKELNLDNAHIFCPLSYGDGNYRSKIVNIGKELFESNFIPIIEMMHLDRYLDLLGTIEIAIFNHHRQQAMGNIITLLGMGKTVYIKQNTSQASLFNKIGIKVFNIDTLRESGLIKLDKMQQKSNIRIMKTLFNKDSLFYQWKNIFNFQENSLNVK